MSVKKITPQFLKVGSGSASGYRSGSALKKITGSRSALNECGSTALDGKFIFEMFKEILLTVSALCSAYLCKEN